MKPVFTGVLIGAALFFMPFFVLRITFGFLIIFTLIRLFSRGRYRSRFTRGFHPAFADNIRNMSDAEYNNFKESYSRNCGRRNSSIQTENESKK